MTVNMELEWSLGQSMKTPHHRRSLSSLSWFQELKRLVPTN